MTTVSIIICTRNRAESLRHTLHSIAACDVPADVTAELLVIDNGSTDDTRDIVSQAKMPNLSLRYSFEAKAGLSHARNRGLAEGKGDIYLFTDDDVRVPGNWIDEMCRPIAEGRVELVAGGVVFPPPFEAALSGLPRSFRSWFASTEEINATTPQRMVGANMAFGRRVLEAVPQFDVRLGAGALGSYEETLFSSQALEAGFRITSRFDTPVEHHFDLGRIQRKELLRCAKSMGRSTGYIRSAHPDGVGGRRALWRAFKTSVKLALFRLTRYWTRNGDELPEWEAKLVEAVGFHWQLAVMRGRHL